jgi:putative flavoprotein involved in K+ transport
MQDTRVDTVVIGGGQAGLAAGYYLKRQGRDFVILDAHHRLGESWRRRWDSLRLFTPANLNSLPGIPFPGPAGHYPTKDEMAGYLEDYAVRLELPVRLGVRVLELMRDGQGYGLVTMAGRLVARQVIVAAGAYRTPRVPAFASQLDPAVTQLHSVEYRNPSQLRDGPVLIVGAGNSGAEIAMDLASTHPVWLSGRHPGHVPAGYTASGRSHWIATLVVGLALHLTADTWPGRWALGRAQTFTGGHPVVRVQPEQLQAVGVQRVPRMAGVQAGGPVLADGRVLDVANVIWCTGFKREFNWIRLPIFDADGAPRHHRGVVHSEPGLYFLGLPFQSSVLSGILASAGPDAQYVVTQVARRARATIPVFAIGEQTV